MKVTSIITMNIFEDKYFQGSENICEILENKALQ